MRCYYVFSIKKEFLSLYRDRPSNLYHIFSQIRTMNKKDVNYGYALLNQIICPINKDKLDQELFLKLHREIYYTKRDNRHCINQLYKDEISFLENKNIYIKIESNKDVSSFFTSLMNNDFNYFVCDFTYQDYFWLNDLKVLV